MMKTSFFLKNVESKATFPQNILFTILKKGHKKKEKQGFAETLAYD